MEKKCRYFEQKYLMIQIIVLKRKVKIRTLSGKKRPWLIGYLVVYAATA